MIIKRLALAGLDNGVPGALDRKEIRDRLAVTLQTGNALVQLALLNRMRRLKPSWEAVAQRRRTVRLLKGIRNSYG